MHWYDDFDHIGYDREGNQIKKSAKGDSLDNFLKQEDDPTFWYCYLFFFILFFIFVTYFGDWNVINYIFNNRRTIYDKLNDKSIVLSEEQLELVHAIQKRRFPAGYDPYMVRTP